MIFTWKGTTYFTEAAEYYEAVIMIETNVNGVCPMMPYDALAHDRRKETCIYSFKLNLEARTRLKYYEIKPIEDKEPTDKEC